MHGDRFVLVVDAAEGATIRVVDSSDTELGDGSGDVIRLWRALSSGETIRVHQRLGECLSDDALSIDVQASVIHND